MSRGIDREIQEDLRVLRRSERQRKRTVVTANNSKSDLESETESETGTTGDWSIEDLIDRNETVSKERRTLDRLNSSDNNSDTETESTDNWDLNSTIVEPSESTNGFSDFSEDTRLTTQMANKEQGDRDGRSTVSIDSGRGTTPEPGMGDFLRVYVEDQRRQREETARRDEESRRVIDAQQRLLEAMMTRTEVRDAPRPTPSVVLPRLKEGGDVEAFMTALETSLTVAEVPRDEWKTRLISSLPVETIVRINSTLTVEGAGYDEIAEALRGSSAITFCSAAEDLSSGEKGKAFDKDIRSAASRFLHLHMTVAKEACSMREMAQILTVVRLRDNLVPELKTYIDTGKRFLYNDFVAACEEWVRSQPGDVSCFKKQRPHNHTHVRGLGNGLVQNSQPQTRQKPTCFSCGKVGHRSKGHTEITCFRCNKKGHKSPDCPSRPRGNRRVQVPNRKPVRLQEEEIFGTINNCDLPVTIDTGAQISIIPIECVKESQMMGRKMSVRSFQGSVVEGEACIVCFEFDGRSFEREGVAVPGETINWTRELARERNETMGDDMYVKPTMAGGKLFTGYRVSSPVVEDNEAHIPSDISSVVEGEKAIKLVEKDDLPETVDQVMKDMGRIEVEEKRSRSSSMREEVSGDHGSVDEGIREEGSSESGEEDGVLKDVEQVTTTWE